MNILIQSVFLENFEKSPMILTASDGTVVWVNSSCRKNFPSIIPGENTNIDRFFEFLSDEDSLQKHESVQSQLIKALPVSVKNQSMYEGLSISDGAETLYVLGSGILADHDIAEKINNLLRTDFLTGCGNRRYFLERLAEFCSHLKRNSNNTFALISADLNKFKYINDTFGHDAGDEVLKMFAHAICNVIRTEDVFARMGGDEFSMIIECKNESECRTFVDKLRTVTSEIEIPDDNHHLSSSYGYVFVEEPADPEKLLKDADDYLYIDKNRISNI